MEGKIQREKDRQIVKQIERKLECIKKGRMGQKNREIVTGREE